MQYMLLISAHSWRSRRPAGGPRTKVFDFTGDAHS
jgi:hypothetical protein